MGRRNKFKCLNPTNNERCSETVNKDGGLCRSCAGKAGSAKGTATKRKTGNWGVETKQKNGTLKHSAEAKQNISNGLKKVYNSGKRKSWNKGLSSKTDDRVAKTGKSRPGELNPMYGTSYLEKWKQELGEEKAEKKNKEVGKLKSLPKEKNGMFGKTHSQEVKQNLRDREFSNDTRMKMREASIRRVKSLGGGANYNKNSIDIIKEYGNHHGYNFRTAESDDGEFIFRGFYADGYDEAENIWVEYDEPHHFKAGKLKTRDLKRQTEIIEHLNCKFIRIKYDGTITII